MIKLQPITTDAFTASCIYEQKCCNQLRKECNAHFDSPCSILYNILGEIIVQYSFCKCQNVYKLVNNLRTIIIRIIETMNMSLQVNILSWFLRIEVINFQSVLIAEVEKTREFQQMFCRGRDNFRSVLPYQSVGEPYLQMQNIQVNFPRFL